MWRMAKRTSWASSGFSGRIYATTALSFSIAEVDVSAIMARVFSKSLGKGVLG